MATFRIPSHLIDAGASRPPLPRVAHRSHPTYGDGATARLILERCDAFFESLVFAGYHPVAFYVSPGDGSGTTLSFEDADSLSHAVGWINWQERTGFPAPGADVLTVAVVLDERSRYIGAGPTFAVPLPSLASMQPINDVTNDAVVRVRTLTRPSVVDASVGQVLRCIQFESQPSGMPMLGRQSAAFLTAAPAISSLVLQDLTTAVAAATASGTAWHHRPFEVSQLGLLSVFIGPRWRYAMPWLDDDDRQAIEAFGAELYQAISSGTLSAAALVATQVVNRTSVGDLVALARGLPVAPASVQDLTAHLAGRLATVSATAAPPGGGPFENIHERSLFRMLLLAHELRVVDILGSSSAAEDPAHVAAVAAALQAANGVDVTGRYETAGAWVTIANIDPSWMGMLQLNHVGSCITGLWQSRGWRDEAAGTYTTVAFPVTGELHDVSLPEAPIVRFSLDGQTWAGLFRFHFAQHDTDDTAASIEVEFGAVTIGTNTVVGSDPPPGVSRKFFYERWSRAPYLHDHALESLAELVRRRVEPRERGGLHAREARIVDNATAQLAQKIRFWVTTSGGLRWGTAIEANTIVATVLTPYLHPDDASGPADLIRDRVIAALLEQELTIGANRTTVSDQARSMALAHPAQTPDLSLLLGLDGNAPGGGDCTYDWYFSMVGGSGDLHVGYGLGAGELRGVLTVTKHEQSVYAWTTRYDAWLMEGGVGAGVGGGILFSKFTGGTITSNISVDPEDVPGRFEMWGIEHGALVARWGSAGGITFYGNGTHPPLSGPAGGLNIAVGPYAALIDAGVAVGMVGTWGSLGNFVPDPDDVQAVSGQTVTAGDYDGNETYFEVMSSVVRAEMVPPLERMLSEHLAAFMSPYGKIFIDGHTSATGPDAVNDPLSVRRARAVAEAIRMLLGPHRMAIPEENIEIVGHGESQAPGGPDGPEVDEARKVETFLGADLKLGYR